MGGCSERRNPSAAKLYKLSRDKYPDGAKGKIGQNNAGQIGIKLEKLEAEGDSLQSLISLL